MRDLQEYLNPEAEHWLDWFHITMRLTVLGQYAKGVKEKNVELAEKTEKALERIKHYLWHGNVFQALQIVDNLEEEIEDIEAPNDAIRKLLRGVYELHTYINNNRGYIPNFGERYRNGESISTAFVESTVNQVISKRFVKKQSMVRHEVARRNERMSTLSVVLSWGGERGGGKRRETSRERGPIFVPLRKDKV